MPAISVVTLASLAAERRLPVEFLASLGVHDLHAGGVGIPYYQVAGGEPIYVRERDCPRHGRLRFWQPKGVDLQPYGTWRLPRSVLGCALVLVEGETDCWA